MIKHFVMLGTHAHGNVVPLIDSADGTAVATFHSRVDANRAAEMTSMGQMFGFTVYTTEVPG